MNDNVYINVQSIFRPGPTLLFRLSDSKETHQGLMCRFVDEYVRRQIGTVRDDDGFVAAG